MLPLAYTESLELKEHLRAIDALRVQLLTLPLMPKTELKLRWEAKITRIHSSLTLADSLLSRGQVVKILASQTKHVPSEYRDVLAYKQALGYIEEAWVANPKPVTLAAITKLAELALPLPNDTRDQAIKFVETPIKTTLEYLENQKDHPIIQAGIALCLLSTSAAIAGDHGIVARLMASIFLAKYGYDVRGLMTVEKNWVSAQTSYDLALASLTHEGNLNHWLLFFATTVEENLRERHHDITEGRGHQDLPAGFWELNDRQKSILQYLDDPTSSMTNKKVQKLFDISQITASRDLSKLTTLGLLYPHGRGRSTSYTKT